MEYNCVVNTCISISEFYNTVGPQNLLTLIYVLQNGAHEYFVRGVKRRIPDRKHIGEAVAFT